jgi:hypothetical protein
MISNPYFNIKNTHNPIKNSRRLINYSSYLNFNHCSCRPDISKKLSANPNSSYDSRNLRISQTINSTRGGGRIQFGNAYLGVSIGAGLNYLGRLEGMPGGSGAPIKNKY